MDVVVMQRKIGYVLRIPVSALPPSLPQYIRLICDSNVIVARLLTSSINYAYYRVYNRYTISLAKQIENGGNCAIEFYDDENTLI